eukprot:768632-Hanusia_phi.AAC.2
MRCRGKGGASGREGQEAGQARERDRRRGKRERGGGERERERNKMDDAQRETAELVGWRLSLRGGRRGGENALYQQEEVRSHRNVNTKVRQKRKGMKRGEGTGGCSESKGDDGERTRKVKKVKQGKDLHVFEAAPYQPVAPHS